MANLEIQISRRGHLCSSRRCPVQHILLEGQTRECEEDGISFNEVRDLCLAHGLIPRNGYYGEALSREVLERTKNAVFTADCTHGLPAETTYTNCGSILVSFGGDPILDNLKLAVEHIKTQWLLNNKL